MLLSAAALLAVDIYLYGSWTNRWARSRELEEAVARLNQTPLDSGDWRAEDQELTPREVERGEIAGHLRRRYRNRRTGEVVSVLLLVGRAGPMSVHTPDVCYRGAGYRQSTPESRAELTLPGTDSVAQFRTADFVKEAPATTSRLRIYWAWNAHGAWEAPDNARTALAGWPAVYKLYVVRQTVSSNQALEDRVVRDFLGQLLPQLQSTLFPSAPPPGPGNEAR
jgi:hypothetical protein